MQIERKDPWYPSISQNQDSNKRIEQRIKILRNKRRSQRSKRQSKAHGQKTPNKKETSEANLITPSISRLYDYQDLEQQGVVKIKIRARKRTKEEREEKMADITAEKQRDLDDKVAQAQARSDKAASDLSNAQADAGSITPLVSIKDGPIFVLDQDIEVLIRLVFDVKATDSHEVIEALEHDNTTTWTRFIKLDDEDISELTKAKSNNYSARVPISTKYKKELMSFRKMIHENKDKDISSYDPDEINDYSMRIILRS